MREKIRRYLCLFILFFFRLRYEVKAIGAENIETDKGVLLLGNHVSWIDWAFVQIAYPKCIEFVMHKEIYELKFHRKFLNFMGVIPLSIKAPKNALREIRKALSEKKSVCIFPEGTISYNSQMGILKKGYEKAVKGVKEGVIIPFYIKGIFYSRFSRSDRKKSSLFRRKVAVVFGEALPLDTKTSVLRRKIHSLSLEAERYLYAKESLLKRERRRILEVLNPSFSSAFASVCDKEEFINEIFINSKEKFYPLYNETPLDAAKFLVKKEISYLFADEKFLKACVLNKNIHPLMLSTLKYIITFDKVSLSLINEFEDKFKKILYTGFKTKEIPFVSLNLPDVLETGYFKIQKGYKKGSVGMPLPGVEVREENGKIYARSSVNFKWIDTKERGFLDEEGFLFIERERFF